MDWKTELAKFLRALTELVEEATKKIKETGDTMDLSPEEVLARAKDGTVKGRAKDGSPLDAKIARKSLVQQIRESKKQ